MSPERHTRRAILAAAVALAPTSAVRAADDVEAVLNRMTIEDLVGALFVVPILGTALTADETVMLATMKPGGVILVSNNIGTDEEVRSLVAAIHATNPSLPPLVSIDQEGGLVARLEGDPAPDAPTLGTLPLEDITRAAAVRGEYLASFGIDVNFAPVADVAWSPDSFMTGRAFGSDQVLVAEDVAAYVTGGNTTTVIHCAKHFPGHGRAATDSHYALPVVDLTAEEWRSTDALPFAAAIDAGVPMIMLGHLFYPQWDDRPSSLSHEAVRVLREDLMFDGVIISDDLGMDALADFDAFAITDLAMDAGVDTLLFAKPKVPVADLAAHVLARISTGDLEPATVRERARRLVALRADRPD
ncbi:MAG: glycoside hydrolase family 3 N-terminal domain-containing protein [Chloroflexota bacterium]